MLLKNLILSMLALGKVAMSAPVDVVSNTEASEFGAYVNPNPKNICGGDELETLQACASEVLAKLDECKPDDLLCECCALQSMNRDCYGLCPNTPSGSFLAVLYDDCETMNDVNACNLPFKKHDTQVAKFLRPNSRIPVEDKDPDFVLHSLMTNTTNDTVQLVSHFEASEKVVAITDMENMSNISNSTDEENGAAVSGLSTAAKWQIVVALLAACFF